MFKSSTLMNIRQSTFHEFSFTFFDFDLYFSKFDYWALRYRTNVEKYKGYAGRYETTFLEDWIHGVVQRVNSSKEMVTLTS